MKPTRQPAEEERVEVRFTMREGETEVECLIDESAVDDLDDPEDDTLVDRYARHRAVFEAIASWLFDEREVPRVELHRVVQFRERAVP